MTNRNMVKPSGDSARVQVPNKAALPPMPAPEDSDRPTTRQEPFDSPQPNASVHRDPPSPDKPGLAGKR